MACNLLCSLIAFLAVDNVLFVLLSRNIPELDRNTVPYIINHLLISNAHITQEWQLIGNTAMAENPRFLQQKLKLHILQIEHMNTT
jgi:hypothetical protein